MSKVSKRALSALLLLFAPACADIESIEQDDSDQEVSYSEAALETAPGVGRLPSIIKLEPAAPARFEIAPKPLIPVQIRKNGDFNADGRADIAWHDDKGETSLWLMDGVVKSSVGLPPVYDKNWHVVGSGEFNGDQQNDLIWHNIATGQISFWFMNGTTFAGYNDAHTVSPSEWQMQGVGDFNRDRHSDVLWRRASDGLLHVWIMDGVRVQSTVDIDSKVADPAWQVGGIGDFDHDGHSDILWRYLRPGAEQGRGIIWRMDGHRYTSSYELPTVNDLSWQMRSVGDYNGDGDVDIAWRNQATGQVSVWLMKRAVLQQSLDGGWAGTSWKMNGVAQTPKIKGKRPDGVCLPGHRPVKEFDPELKTWVTECILNPISCPPRTAQEGTACVPCGGQGQPSCATAPACAPGLAAYTGFCLPCGGEGQRSCGPDVNGCQGGMELHANLCRICGALGQPTCKTRALCDGRLEVWHGACRVPVRRVPEPHEGCGGALESCCRNPVYTRGCTDPRNECRTDGWFGVEDICMRREDSGGSGGGGSGGGGSGGGGAGNDVSFSAQICTGDPVPVDHMIVNDFYDPTRCGSPHALTYNVQQTERYTGVGVGYSIRVCAGQAVPDGWRVTKGEWDPTSCGYPSVQVDNTWHVLRER